MSRSPMVLVVGTDRQLIQRLTETCQESGAEVVGVAAHGEAALDIASTRGADVGVVEVGSLEGVWRLPIPVVAVGTTYGITELVDAVLAGASGYLPVGSRPPQVSWAIERVLAGDLAVPTVLLNDVLDELVCRITGTRPRIAA